MSLSTNLDFLATAFGAVSAGANILPKHRATELGVVQSFDLGSLHASSLQWSQISVGGSTPALAIQSGSQGFVQIFVQTLTGKTITVVVDPHNKTTEALKLKVRACKVEDRPI